MTVNKPTQPNPGKNNEKKQSLQVKGGYHGSGEFSKPSNFFYRLREAIDPDNIFGVRNGASCITSNLDILVHGNKESSWPESNTPC